MSTEKSRYLDYVGIDVGKFTLEVGFIEEARTYSYANDKDGWRLLWQEHRKRLKQALVVVETTGWYERGVLHFLVRKQVAVHRAPARLVKQFIASYGVIAKTDAIDAKKLAQYGKERGHTLSQYEIPDELQAKLQLLYSRSIDLKRMLVQEKNRLQAPGYEEIGSFIQPVINTLEKQIEKITAQLQELVQSTPLLLRKYKVLRTVEGIGDLTAIALLASLPELGQINRKQAASLAGLAPHPKDSGTKTGYRFTRGGRQHIKEITHMAALGAINRKTSKLKEFYLHLINDNNKKPLVALTAVKRKIIVIANARLAEI
jgi:transposase